MNPVAGFAVYWQRQRPFDQKAFLEFCIESLEATGDKYREISIAPSVSDIKSRQMSTEKARAYLDSNFPVIINAVSHKQKPQFISEGWTLILGYSEVSFEATVCAEAGFGAEQLRSLALRFRDFVDYDYAIGFNTIFGMGPIGYALGGNASTPQTPAVFTPKMQAEYRNEEQRLLQWFGRNREPFREGKQVRDVYSFNVLKEHFASLTMEGKKLRDWIAEKEYRGSIEPMGDAMWIWIVEEKRIDHIRKELGLAGLLRCYPP